MRNFVLAGSLAAAGATLETIANGALGIFYFDDGVAKITTTGEEVKNRGLIVLGRTATAGGNVVLPLYNYHFSYVKAEKVDPTVFKATVKVSAPTAVGAYTLVIAKKGVLFNERNKYSSDVYLRATGTTANQLATLLADQINKNTDASGVKATVAADTITIEAVESGVDYAVLAADELSAVITVTTKGLPGQGNPVQIKDLAEKAAADAGFEYTYADDGSFLYPNYPLSPLPGANGAIPGITSQYTVYTLRFAEPRDMKTRDEVVHQIVQIGFPSAVDTSAFDTILANLGVKAEAEPTP